MADKPPTTNKIDPRLVRVAITDAINGEFGRDHFPLGMYSIDVSKEFKNPGETTQVPVDMGAGPPLFNVDDWTATNTVIEMKSVTMHRITRTACFTIKEYNNGSRRRTRVGKLVRSVRTGIDLMTEREFQHAPNLNIGKPEVCSHKTLNEKAWPVIRQPGIKPSVYLATDFAARLLPENMLSLGMNGNSSWENVGIYDNAGAAKNFAGIACNPEALILANCLPAEAMENVVLDHQETIEAPDSGLVFHYTEWFEPNKRKFYCSLDTMIGITKGADFNSLVLTSDDSAFVADLLEGIDEIPDVA